MSLSEIFYDYLEEPDKAREEITVRPPMALALGGFLTAALSLSLWNSLKTGGLVFFTLKAGAIFLWNLFSAFLWAALIHWYASIKSPEPLAPKTAKSILVYFGLSDFAWSLTAVAAFASLLERPWRYFSLLIFALSAFLNFALKARGVKSVYRFSGPKSWLLILAPYAAFFIFGMSFLIFSLLGLFLR